MTTEYICMCNEKLKRHLMGSHDCVSLQLENSDRNVKLFVYSTYLSSEKTVIALESAVLVCYAWLASICVYKKKEMPDG